LWVILKPRRYDRGFILGLFAQLFSTSQQVQNTGDSAIWMLANLSFAGMRTQNHGSIFWRTVSFVSGLLGTVVSFFAAGPDPYFS